jgi:hypothetical protein
VEGALEVVPKMDSAVPQKGWLLDKEHQIRIPKLAILTPRRMMKMRMRMMGKLWIGCRGWSEEVGSTSRYLNRKYAVSKLYSR